MAAEKPINALVVGVPRSGTSLTTAIFARQGYYLADDADNELRDGDEHNPSGYFEAASLIDRNVEVFSEAGFSSHNTWLFDAIAPDQVNAIANLQPIEGHKDYVRSYDAHSPWVWKDPRLCYTLAYWWQLLDPETTRVLLLKRNVEETWNSFLRLDWREDTADAKADVLKRINDHLGAAEQAIATLNIPHIEVHYDDFARSPKATSARIGEFFNLSLDTDALQFDPGLNSSKPLRRLQTKVQKGLRSLKGLLPNAARSRLKQALRG